MTDLEHIERLRVALGEDDPFVRHVLGWLEAVWDLKVEVSIGSAGGTAPDIAYGMSGELKAGVAIPCESKTTQTPPMSDDFDRVPVDSLAGRYPFDFFAAIKYWWTDQAHASLPESAYDAHGRLKFQHAVHGGDRPIAHPIVLRYVTLLGRMIEGVTGRRLHSPWPDGKKAVVLLSHDVDAPLNLGSFVTGLHQARAKWNAGGKFGAAYIFASVCRMIAGRWLRGKFRAEERWLFDKLADSESRRGFRSTFFFASRHGWMKGSSYRDVRYDLAAPRFRPVFDRLNRDGFEVALHASYNVLERDGLLDEEIRRLEAASGGKVVGNRHHFWHLGRPMWSTLRMHERSALAYDSSISFNDGLGWRLGTGLPFEPWDPQERRPIRVVQIPVMLMDGVLWYDSEDTEENARRNLARVDALLDVLVRHGAAGSIDWHACSSYPGRSDISHWGRSYQAVLDLLAARSDIWVTTCRELCEYWQRRGRSTR